MDLKKLAEDFERFDAVSLNHTMMIPFGEDFSTKEGRFASYVKSQGALEYYDKKKQQADPNCPDCKGEGVRPIFLPGSQYMQPCFCTYVYKSPLTDPAFAVTGAPAEPKEIRYLQPGDLVDVRRPVIMNGESIDHVCDDWEMAVVRHSPTSGLPDERVDLWVLFDDGLHSGSALVRDVERRDNG